MLNFIAKPLVKLVERYLPDPYIFVLLLSVLVFVAAVVFEQQSPLVVAQQWGDGFWGLLSFSMQMLLVLVTGFMLASTPLVSKLLDRLAMLARNAGQAIVLVTLVSLMASWLNWGFGLVVGALFAKALARRVQVDYPLLVASAYSGFVIWHGGLSGSVPLTIATSGHFSEAQIGIIPSSDTIFAWFNLVLVAALFISVPLLNYLMRPKAEDSVYIDPAKLEAETLPDLTTARPADKLENSFVFTALIALAAAAYLLQYFAKAGGLNLNIVNFLFLFLAILLHGTPRRLLHSLQQAIQGGTGIILQFPFYAGIMAVMMQSGLAQSLSQWFVSFATAESLAFWTFLSAGLVNIFIPSGGGQWAVQAPVMLPAALELGAEVNRIAMAVAWGDAWTNLIQPFWALPVLAIAGLKAKDVMGYCLLQLLVTGIIISLVLSFI
ncbi:MAG: TIGR00366 family protein [Gammaproteobacteria bacterium]|nr:TIGR00366 family protein [Gammaproteobacteria bacterium]MBU2058203.1 TIGR00366 family protein [Gammaproteobacteria bacterium]MBU2176966.1 TIGR00366 family protein [Gammaproteobacteria bacterium]MBU2246579.1 TIGR00366 family protein [Gammaproteobacteria bacterium]MBU2344960.1 TIGR00366 family protein [Gammaproteobacteria bacterium]